MTQLVVRVSVDGTIQAVTREVTGPRCLDYIDVLEDLLEAETLNSAFTADYTAHTTTDEDEVRRELPQW
jgi:DUF2997 family protein